MPELPPDQDNVLLAYARPVLKMAGMDRATFYGVLAKMWSALSGPISLLLITRFFSPPLQGYYYTFSSMLALQFFVELGLGQVLVQFVSHEATHLHVDAHGELTGDTRHLNRLAALGKMSFRWYLAISTVFTLAFAIAGYVFFHRQSDVGLSWQGPWFSFALIAGISLMLTPALCLLEGANQVKRLNWMRLVQGVVASVAMWSGVVAGAGLWVCTFSQLANLLVAALFIFIFYRNFFRFLLRPVQVLVDGISWAKEIWPMQWRIALSWMSGYFSFYFFTPVIFHYHGAVEAGRLGMTWTVLSALNGVAGMWISVKVPAFGMLIAKKSYAELDRMFYKSTTYAFAMAFLGGAAWCLIILGMSYFHHPFASRVLPLLPTVLFVLGVSALQINAGMAYYLRAHKQEPLFIMSVIRAVITAGAIYFLGKYYGVVGVASGYVAIVFLLLPIEMTIWRVCRARWHTASQVA